MSVKSNENNDSELSNPSPNKDNNEELTEANEERILKAYNYKTPIHMSYALGSFFDDFSSTAFSIMGFFFYNTRIGLATIYVSIAYIIYGIWNMLNDPLAGYLSDRPRRFLMSKGKRFPIFLITIFPTALIYSIIFMPPKLNGNNEILVFLWLLLSISLFDGFFSFWNTNWMAVFPNKFRSQKERTKVGAIQTMFSQIGLALGMLLPPLFLTTDAESYRSTAMIITGILIVVAVLMIPGMQDKDILKQIYRDTNSEGKEISQIGVDQSNKRAEQTEPEQLSYFKTLVFALKQKNFLSYLLAYLGQTVMMTVMLAALPYFTNYVLGYSGDEADTIQLTMSALILIGGLTSLPIWTIVARKFGNRIGYMCGTGITSILLLILLLSSNINVILTLSFLIGMSIGATWSLLYPTFSDVIDELVLKLKARNEAIFYGFRTFIGRLSIVIQALAFGVTFELFGFDPNAAVQSASAQLGIRIVMTVVPMIFYIIGFLVMWRIYDLKPAKVVKIKAQLKELKL
ncbi:MAG: MFS transporter [Promethearchaeota archaeon]